MDELLNKVEAILYASGKGVTEEELANYCEEKIATVVKAVKKLQEEFEKQNRSLIVNKHNERWKLTVRGKYTPFVQQIVSETELPGPILKTLAVIAYKSPVLQSDIVNMRGQNAYEHIKLLVKEKFITKEEQGRTYLLKITNKFYNYFDVEGDGDIREIFENLRKQQQKMTELEVVEILKDQETLDEKSGKLGELNVVDASSDREKNNLEQKKETPIQPRKKEKSEEERKEEEHFLKGIDEKIDELSQRVQTQQLPRQDTHHKTEENEETKKEKNDEEENDKDSLEELEEFAEKQKKTDEKNYL